MRTSSTKETDFPKDFYFNHFYFQFPAMSSMCHQIETVYSQSPTSILEIGKGNGFVSDFLRKSGFDVTTFDINSNLKPDVVGSVTELGEHFEAKSFDLVLCAEVLEHIPFANFETSVQQIARIARRNVVLTLPRAQSFMFSLAPDLSLKAFGRGRVFKPSIFLSLPSRKISSQHHWEIDSSRQTRMRKIKALLARDTQVRSVERVRYCPYHYMFNLRPN